MATIEFEQRLKKGEKGLRDALASHMDKGTNYADVRDFIHDVRQILINHELSELFQTGLRTFLCPQKRAVYGWPPFK